MSWIGLFLSDIDEIIEFYINNELIISQIHSCIVLCVHVLIKGSFLSLFIVKKKKEIILHYDNLLKMEN